jgi:5-methylcytosine-specific restriction endonuclease McrA
MECERTTRMHPNGTTGTNAGFGAHERAGEEPCKPCLDAKREYNSARMKEKYGKYRHKQLARNRKRRATKRGLPSDAYSLGLVVETYGAVCYLCEGEVDLSITDRNDPRFRNIDHLVPLSNEDSPGDILENVRITHGLCNRRKGSLLIEDLDLPFSPPT